MTPLAVPIRSHGLHNKSPGLNLCTLLCTTDMPRASHDRLHRAMFGASTPLAPRQRRTCYAQLFVASTMLLLATGGLAMGWPTLGDLAPLVGAAAAYSLSILVCWRDRGLYTRLMIVW